MTNEEAARLLDPETNLAAMEELQYYHGFAWQEILVKALREARKMGADALRNTGCFRGEPLTLEQLREMDGQPVWVKVLDARFNEENQWAICNAEYQMVTLKDGFKLFFCGYESNWLAYAYHPTHIDRKAWTAEWVKHDGYTECSKCEHWYDSPENEDEGDQPAFCPSCGRAMTPEAWAELERRISRKEEQ